MQDFIHRKSWLMHCFLILTRMCLSIFGIDIWQISFSESKSNIKLNQEFIRASEPYLVPVLFALIPLGAILDISIWFRPQLAQLICYFEFVFLATLMFCPLDFGALSHVAVTIAVFLEYFLFGNFDGPANIMFTAIVVLRFLLSESFIDE